MNTYSVHLTDTDIQFLAEFFDIFIKKPPHRKFADFLAIDKDNYIKYPDTILAGFCIKFVNSKYAGGRYYDNNDYTILTS